MRITDLDYIKLFYAVHRCPRLLQLLKNAEGFDGTVPPDEVEEAQNEFKNPRVFRFDTAAPMSETEANTLKVETKSTAMKHIEGGWPKEVR